MGEVFPEAKYQRCTVHFYCNVFSVTPRSKVKLAAKMLKAIHAQESRKAAREKAKAVVEGLCSMKLKEAAKKVEDGIEETLTYCDFPSEHWTRIRTNAESGSRWGSSSTSMRIYSTGSSMRTGPTEYFLHPHEARRTISIFTTTSAFS